MRVCDKCGQTNDDPKSSDDIWCNRCSNFLGFPAESRAHERRIGVQLLEDRVSVPPGGETRLGAWVRNGGDVVEKVTFAVEGQPGPWTQIEPDEVGLFPKQKGEIQLVFRPRRHWQVRSGLTPFRLVATSQSDVTVVDHVDGSLDVGAFVDVTASLTPLQSTGPEGGEHHLQIENAGNTVMRVRVQVSQPGGELSFTTNPESLELEPGAKGEARITVAPQQTLYGAADKRYPFVVNVLAPGQSPIALQAVHLQEAASTAPSLVLGDTRLHAAPGEEAATTVIIRNRGRGGEDRELELLGPAADWGRIIPHTIALPTAGEAQARIAFVPPAAPPAPASEIPFAVRCFSRNDPERSTVVEGVLTVDPVTRLDFDVQPALVRARWSSRHVIDVENNGNAVADLRAVLVSPAWELAFAVSPAVVRVLPNSRESVLFKARTRRPRLLRKSTARVFDVLLAPATTSIQGMSGQEEARRHVGFEQISILPRTLTALAVVAAVTGGLAVAALAIFAKQIHQLL